MKTLTTLSSLLYLTSQAQKTSDEPKLYCQPNKIYITITKHYLRKHRLLNRIQTPQQLHFKDHPACFATDAGDSYVLNLYTPFTACGTLLNHGTEDYIYTNEVVIDKSDGKKPIKLVEMRCVYEDKYVVSSGPITPTKNTLTFSTEFGEFEANMHLYAGDRFDDSVKLDDRPAIQLSERVYVGINLYAPFSDSYVEELSVSVQNCYANDSPDHQQMDIYHYLISGMCVAPDDKTVRIYQNGVPDMQASQFSFEMFRFRKGLDYIYLHCELKLCNTTIEVCEGSNPFCNGQSRKKRAFTEQVLTRTKREDISEDENMADPDDATIAYLSRGPIVINQLDREAKETVLTTALDEIALDDDFLKLWVVSGVAAVIGITGILLTVYTIIKRRQEQLKLQQNGTVIRVETPAPKGGMGLRTSAPMSSLPGK